MSQCSECHKKLVKGEGKCSVPMWMDGMPAGFCDAPAYGEPTAHGMRNVYRGYVPFLACPAHGGPTKPNGGPDADPA